MLKCNRLMQESQICGGTGNPKEMTRSSVCPCSCVSPSTNWKRLQESIWFKKSLIKGFSGQQTWILKSVKIRQLPSLGQNPYYLYIWAASRPPNRTGWLQFGAALFIDHTDPRPPPQPVDRGKLKKLQPNPALGRRRNLLRWRSCWTAIWH